MYCQLSRNCFLEHCQRQRRLDAANLRDPLASSPLSPLGFTANIFLHCKYFRSSSASRLSSASLTSVSLEPRSREYKDADAADSRDPYNVIWYTMCISCIYTDRRHLSIRRLLCRVCTGPGPGGGRPPGASDWSRTYPASGQPGQPRRAGQGAPPRRPGPAVRRPRLMTPARSPAVQVNAGTCQARVAPGTRTPSRTQSRTV
jgi:hypothetical protein